MRKSILGLILIPIFAMSLWAPASFGQILEPTLLWKNDLLRDCTLWCQFSGGEDHAIGSPNFGMGRIDDLTGLRTGHADYHRRNVKSLSEWYEYLFDEKQTVLLHLPFGRYTTDVQTMMSAFSILDAQDQGHTFWYDEFVSTYEPMVNNGHRIIFYNGAIHHTKRYTLRRNESNVLRELGDNVQAGVLSDLNNREIYEAHRLPLSIGCELAIDNSAGINRPLDSRNYLFLKQNQGTPVWVEAGVERADRDYEELRLMNTIIRWRTFKDRHIDGLDDQRFPLVNDDDYYEGEVMVLLEPEDVTVNNEISLSEMIMTINQIKSTGAKPALNLILWRFMRGESSDPNF